MDSTTIQDTVQPLRQGKNRMAIKPEDLAKVMADSFSRQTYLSTRATINEEMQAGIIGMLSAADKHKYLVKLYTLLGFSAFKGDTGIIFMKGSQKRFVPFPPKPETKAYVSLHRPVRNL